MIPILDEDLLEPIGVPREEYTNSIRAIRKKKCPSYSSREKGNCNKPTNYL